MTTIDTTDTFSAASFAEFIRRQSRIDNGEKVDTLLLRNSKFNAEFSAYKKIGTARFEFTRHDGSTLKFCDTDAIGAFRDPESLPKGDGKIDDGVDGKGAQSGKKSALSENIKYLQTPEDYLKTRMIAPDTAALYYQLLAITDKMSKAEIISILRNITNAIAPDEVILTYESMLEKEARVRALEHFGFTFGPNSHGVTKDGKHVYTGKISYDDRRNYMAEIAMIAVNQKVTSTEDPQTLDITYTVTFELA